MLIRHKRNSCCDDVFYFIRKIYILLNLAGFFSSVCKQIFWDKQKMNDTADNNLTMQMSFGTK